MNEMNALVEEVLKEFLLDVALASKHIAVEHLGEVPPHPRASVVHACGSQAECEYTTHLVAQQMKLEAMTPPHRSLSVLGKSTKQLVEFPSHVVASGNHRTVYETNVRALSKTLDAHENHQVEEHAGHEVYETRVGHGLREVACQISLDEKEVIMLEVAERAKMVAQQDDHDFALRHLPLAVSHALISLTYGCNMEVFSSFGI